MFSILIPFITQDQAQTYLLLPCMGLFALLYASFFFCQTALEARLQKKGVRWEYPGLKSITGKGTPHFFFSRGAGSPFRIYKAFKVQGLEGLKEKFQVLCPGIHFHICNHFCYSRNFLALHLNKS
ncbi:MAG: hypothetical protein AMS15_09215 [Planctomycetes bacterium DG_23]|nr:MAG: hypothetical protein AMS15_09215 [Planctomycetes bacterium DG_23]